MSKTNLNDHYFVSWLNVLKDKDYIIENGKVYVLDLTPTEYGKFLEEYKTSYKPILQKIRKVVKELNNSTTKPRHGK